MSTLSPSLNSSSLINFEGNLLITKLRTLFKGPFLTARGGGAGMTSPRRRLVIIPTELLDFIHVADDFFAQRILRRSTRATRFTARVKRPSFTSPSSLILFSLEASLLVGPFRPRQRKNDMNRAMKPLREPVDSGRSPYSLSTSAMASCFRRILR